MKKFMKLIPVALGLLMLASCSNDDFFSESKVQEDITANMGKGDLLVIAPEFGMAEDNAFTRALRDWEPNKEKWEPAYLFTEKDRIRVYDGTLTNYDFYAYSAKEPGNASGGNKKYAFRLMYDEPNLDGTAKYALYPGEDVIRGGWEFNESINLNEHYMDNHTHGWVKVDIAPKMKYWADYSRIYDPENTTPLYQDRIPTWGMVENIEDGGYVKTKLEYLTGILVWEATGTPKYANFMKVEMYDKNAQEYLPIAGRFETDLVKNKIVQLAYKEVDDPKNPGKKKKVVDEEKTARITYKDVLTADKFNLKDGDYASETSIIVDLQGPIGLEAKDSKVAKVFVPLVCTENPKTPGIGTEVDIIVSTSEDGINWVEDWRLTDQVVKRGKAYYKDATSHMEFKGTTICALTELLEVLADNAKDGDVLEVVAENPIEITDECNQLLIPNKNIALKLDLSKGIYSKSANKQLRVKYKSTAEGQPTPTLVLMKAKCYQDQYRFDMDVRLPKSIFDLVNIPYTNDEVTALGSSSITGNPTPVKALKLDATSFILGDGANTATLEASTLTLSDNVKSLTVDKNAKLDYAASASGSYPCASISIPDLTAEAGYQNAGVEAVTVNGIMNCGIDAHTSVVNVTVQGEPTGKFASLAGEIRTQGFVSALGRGLILPSSCGSRGVAAFGKVTVSGQSFISGSIFSKNAEGGIDIQNENFNANSLLSAGGGLLSDVIYETYTDDDIAKQVVNLIKEGYGPLYAESGSVKVVGTNSELFINNKKLQTIADPTTYAWILDQLNDHAKKTVEYNVYAKTSIDLLGTKITTANGVTMWAEEDVHLGGTKLDETGEVEVYGSIQADRDFVVVGKSAAGTAKVGRNATIYIQDRDGKGNYSAVDQLIFSENIDEAMPANSGNTLFLYQGYVTNVDNGTGDEAFKLNLTHYSQPAFSAIGTATTPDLVIPTNVSKWNGKQIAAIKKNQYVKLDLWTATQLAAQLTGITAYDETLRSDIDLMGHDWTGIAGPDSHFTLIGKRYKMTANDRRLIDNLTITGGNRSGFVGQATNALTVKNIKFDNVKTNLNAVAGGELTGVGGVAGFVGGALVLDNVAVVLGGDEGGEKAYFGSNGVTNLKASKIGGLAGETCGAVTLTAVRVNASDAILNGWHSMGGYVGSANGNVTISDADATNEFGATTGYVNGLSCNITHLNTNPPITNVDKQQGKTGLYIGTHGDLVNKQVSIETSADKYNEAFTRTGKVKENAACWEGTYDSHNGHYVFNRANQTLIGQSGDVANTTNPVLINKAKFYIKKWGESQSPDLQGALYLLLFSGGE